MKLSINDFVALGLVIFVVWTGQNHVGPAQGQQPDGPRGRSLFGGRGGLRGGLGRLLAVREVQAELKMSAEQIELVQALESDLWRQQVLLFRPTPRRGNSNRLSDFPQQMAKLNQQREDLINAIFEPEQAKRLAELRLQREGLLALDRPEFVKELGLDDDQLSKIREIGRDRTSGERRRGLSQEQESQIMDLLTKEQIDKWNGMKGKEFKFPERLSRFGRGRFRGNRGGPPRRPDRPPSDN